MKNVSVKLVRPLEIAIVILAEIIQEEKVNGYITDRNEMVKLVMVKSRGLINPVVVKELVDKLFEERF